MDVDVAIVGFGPVGATLAGLLGRRGLNVVVLERDAEVFPLPRAAHIDHTGLRTVQELGRLEAALPSMVRNQSLDLVNARHRVLFQVPASQESVSNLPLSMYFYQPEFDTLLRSAAAQWPNVDVRLGAEMLRLDMGPSKVRLEVAGQDNTTGVIEASWVVGCDGSWSPVREAAGLALEDLNFNEKWLVLDLRLTGPSEWLPTNRVVQVCDPARPHLSTPICPGRQRFEFMLMPGEDAAEMKQPSVVARLLEPWLAADRYELTRAAVYTFHGLLARSWRNGRVLIAGDAAHQMPPFLGQGMCSGLRDAVNLAWKLDHVVRLGAPESLLDSYEAERAPHVRQVVEAAIRFGRVVCETDPDRAQARDRSLLSRDGAAASGLSFRLPRLPRGALVLEGGGALFPQPVLDGCMLDDLVGQSFLIVARSPAALGCTAAWWRDRMGAYVATPEQASHPDFVAWLDRYQADIVVVRPDRYVLGVGTTLDVITEAVAGQLLERGAGVVNEAIGRSPLVNA